MRSPDTVVEADLSSPSPRFWSIFFALYEGLPRQGPGSRACAERALRQCRHLPPSPDVVDLGCGVGGQTLQLAALTQGRILAIDQHAPSIERLQATIAAHGLGDRVRAIVGDMGQPNTIPPASFDLVWSEGALYNLGLDAALRLCVSLLRPGGYLAFTDAVWRTTSPPPEVKAVFDLDYPGMGTVEDGLAAIQRAGLSLEDHFPLPDEAWWDDFYTPMELRLAHLRDHYSHDAEALAVIEQLAGEPQMHRQHGHTYAYTFFIARRRSGGGGG